MMVRMLVVMSGVPGTGKSSIADALGPEFGAPVLSVDPIEAAIWRCGIPASFATGVAAYEVAAVLAEHQLTLGLTTIVDSVSSIEAARDMWRQAARRAAVIEVVCSDERVHRQRLAERRRSIEGFPELSWDQVQQRRAEWEPWTGDRLGIDTMRTADDNLADALSFLRR